MSNIMTKNKIFTMSNNSVEIDQGNHEYFCKNSYHIDSLLSNYVENIVDLSVNELSIN